MSFLKKWKGTALGAVAAPFTGGLSLGLGALYDVQKQQTERQNQANKNAVDRANAYDMYAWDVANAYNNPKAQVQRLIDAGFNPYTQGAVSAGNSAGVASSNGTADQAVADKTGLAFQVAQAGANLANTWTAVRNGQANREYTDTQNRALQHDLTWAQDHDLPVGTQTSVGQVSGQVVNDVVNYGKKYLKKGVDKGKKIIETSNTYRERNKNRPVWDLVKEQWHDMWS